MKRVISDDGSGYKYPSHTYEKAGIYNIAITGKVDRIRCYGIAGVIEHLTAIVQWGDLHLISLQQGFQRTKITTVPLPDDPAVFANITNSAQIFHGCEWLKEIPEGFFDTMMQTTTFQQAFWQCRSLESVRGDMFAKNVNVTGLSSVFNQCTGLTEIPEEIFANNRLTTSFTSSFSGCTNLKKIPANLFANNTVVTSAGTVFNGCTSLEEIPAGLFDAFTAVKSYPGAFKDCTSLKSIPSGLFDKSTEVANFSDIFRGCTALTGESPYTTISGTKVHLYQRDSHPSDFTAPTKYDGAFAGCIGLSDYSSIPDGWK